MANLQSLRTKINSTKKTQQTTKAMKMVSAAKLRKAQDRIVNARPYAYRIQGVIQRLAQSGTIESPLLSNKKSETTEKTLLVVLTSDRGLCGAFNSSIIRYAREYYLKEKNNREINFLFIGKKGSDYFKKYGVKIVDTIYNLAGTISYDMGRDISERLLKYYLDGEYTEIRMVYNEFKSAISQMVIDEAILPVKQEEENQESVVDFIFEPEAEEILEQLLHKHFAVQVYRCLQESIASEHGARMSAMENATRNAGEMIKQMTLNYNKIRQAAITTELIEITSGAEALNA